MTKARAGSTRKGSRPWWRAGVVRSGANWLLFSLMVAALLVGAVYLTRGSANAPEEAASVGEQVAPFELPDVVTGRNVSLADYIGKQEIVIVSYMGFF